MFTKDLLKNILVLDIETVRGKKTYSELSPEMLKSWEHKAESVKIKDEDSENPWTAEMKYLDRAAIFAEFGRVVCVSVGFISWEGEEAQIRVKSFADTDEAVLLQNFKQMLESPRLQGWKLCAHNGKEFDFPYLCRRFLINQIPIPSILQMQGKKPWETSFIDTMELWKFGDFKNYTKLELLCAVFGIPSPKSDMDGSMVGEVFWEQGDNERIARYCEEDVIATAQLMLAYSCLPLVALNKVLRI
jgi:3'-5' exonuclease